MAGSPPKRRTPGRDHRSGEGAAVQHALRAVAWPVTELETDDGASSSTRGALAGSGRPPCQAGDGARAEGPATRKDGARFMCPPHLHARGSRTAACSG